MMALTPPLRLLLLVGGLVALALLLGLLGPILMPFVIGAGLAYLGDPLVDRLERLRMSRTGGVCLVFALFSGVGILVCVLVVPMVYEQLVSTVQRLPEFIAWIQGTVLPRLGIEIDPSARFDVAAVREAIRENWAQAGGFAALAAERVSRSTTALLMFFSNLLLVPVVTFYLLRDWDLIVERIHRLVPRRYEPKVVELARETDAVLGSFITGQMLVMFSLAVIYSVGLWLAGLELALLIGLLAGVVSFIPYLGAIVGILTASVAMLVQTQELLPLVWVVLVFGFGQVLESVLLTPWLVGDQIGLHPVAVIFAVLAGGQLFGFVGVLLALPAAAVIAVFLRHLHDAWLASAAYGRE